MSGKKRQRNHFIHNDGDELHSQQIRFSAGESYKSTCSKAKCRAHPDYHYTFEVFSPAHGDWQRRDYFYCAAHMKIVADKKRLKVPLLKLASEPLGQDSPYPCIYCGGKVEIRKSQIARYEDAFTECSQCYARGPRDRNPTLATLKWNLVCRKLAGL